MKSAVFRSRQSKKLIPAAVEKDAAMGDPTTKSMKDFLCVLRPHDKFADLVLSKGIWFHGRANASDYEITREWQCEKRPKTGECYTNAQTFCLDVPAHGYFEGYVLFPGVIPMQHAWIVLENRRVVDFTLEAMERKAKRAKVSCDTSNALYFGVEVPKKFVRLQLIVTGFHDSIAEQFYAKSARRKRKK